MIVEPLHRVRTVDVSTEPVTVSEAKAHLRVNHSDDDSYISDLITASRQSAEISVGRVLGDSATYLVSYASFPVYRDFLKIPYPPLLSVSHLKYYDLSDTLQTVPTNQYVVNSDVTDSALIGFKDNFSRPVLSRERKAPVQLTFTAGYNSAVVPKPIKQAILLLVSHYYDIREPILTTGTILKVPRSVDFIFSQYKVRSV